MSENLGPSIQVLGWTLTSISITIVLARFYVRQFVVFRVSADDWTMGLAMLLAVANMATAQISIHHGIGQHSSTLSPSSRALATKWNSFSQPTAIMSPTIGRISFSLTLLGIMLQNQRKRRILVWVNMVLQILANGAMAVIVLTPCRPFERLWDKRVEGSCRAASVQEKYGYFHGAYNSLIDLLLAILPFFLFRNLHLPLRQKIALTLLMGLGIFATGASLGKLVHLKALGNTTDATYANGLLRIWALLEAHVVIIAASLPALRPLYAKYYKGTSYGRYQSGSGSRRTGGKSGSLGTGQGFTLGSVRTTKGGGLGGLSISGFDGGSGRGLRKGSDAESESSRAHIVRVGAGGDGEGEEKGGVIRKTVDIQIDSLPRR